MELLRYGILLLSMCLCMFVRPSTGNAWMMDPPSRSAAWNYEIKAPINYDFRTLNCGNEKVEIQPDGTRNCGICGDPVTDSVPRPNENGGIYAPTTILTRYFESGQTVEISIFNNFPDQLGFYEFRLCENGDNPTQACLDNNLLFINDSNANQMTVPGQGLNRIHVQLPAGLTCSHCLLQWRYKKGNSAWGCDLSTGWCGLGYGAQKEYYNCADVMIGAVGTPKPSIIQDPTYTSADYGSAYDTVTHGPHPTTTDKLVGPTTAAPVTTPRRIITVPPFTTVVPTGSPPVTTPKQDERLVIVDTGNSGNPLVIVNDQNRNNNNNNAGLLLLLGLLPILGALGQTAGGASVAGPLAAGSVAPIGGPVAAPLSPLSPSGFWNSGGIAAAQPYLSDFALGNSFGYGSLGGSYGNKYGSKGSYYGNMNSYYGNNGNTYGTTWGSHAVNRAGNYPLSSNVGNTQYVQNHGNGLLNGQFAQNSFSTVNNMNTLGSNSFVVKSEAFVKNGISRQPLNPAFAGSSGIQGQQSQYQTGQQHQYPTGWQTQQNDYSNNHVDSYNNQFPAPKYVPSTGNAISTWQNNGWNSRGSNSWSNGNQNGFGNVDNNGLGNGNNNGFGNVNMNAFGNANNNGWTNTQANTFTNNFGSGLNANLNSNTNFNNRVKNFGTNGLNNNLNSNWNTAGNQLSGSTGIGNTHTSGITHISHPKSSQVTSRPWQQGNVQSSGKGTQAEPQTEVHNLYYQLFSGLRNQQPFNQGVEGFPQTPPERSM